MYENIPINPKLTLSVHNDADPAYHWTSMSNTKPSLFNVDGKFVAQKIKDALLSAFEDVSLLWESHSMTAKGSALSGLIARVKTENKNGTTSFVLVSVDPQESLYGIPSGRESEYNKFANRAQIAYEADPELAEKVATVIIAAGESGEISEHNKIHIMCVQNGSLTTQSVSMDNYANIDLDANYGPGFQKYHDKLVQTLTKGRKGIAVMYGEPGTGKSFYLRYLASKIEDKVILYVPSSMDTYLGSPDFAAFLLELRGSNQCSGVVIIMEDSEKSVAHRSSDATGVVSTMLNLSDGIMNDFVSVQIIVTFNVSLRNVDSAILRKRRALSIREFKKLDVDTARRLAVSLGVSPERAESIQVPTALSDIYDMSEPADELFDDGDKSAMGFR